MRPAGISPNPTELSARGSQPLRDSPGQDRLPIAIHVPGGFAEVREVVPRPDPDSREALPNAHFDTPTELVESLGPHGFPYQGVPNDFDELVIV